MNYFPLNFFLLIILLLSPFQVWAYPNFISYGYSSCITCHYNPLGGGPLTDYGRAVSAVAISSNLLWNSQASDEQLGNASGFAFRREKQKWFRPSIDARGLRYERNTFSGKRESRFILMQAEANVVLRFLNNERLTFSATYGYAPTPERSKKSNEKVSNYISREHYGMYEIRTGHRLMIGLMDAAFGLRIPDHVAYSRMMTGLAQNDQTHGILYNYINNAFEFSAHAFVGNLSQDASLRPVGFSLMAEYEPWSSFRIGNSFLKSENEFVVTNLLSTHLKFGSGEGGGIISEIGFIKKQPKDIAFKESLGAYGFLQSQVRFFRGMHLLLTQEYFRTSIEHASITNHRLSLGIQYFPVQRLELRADLVNNRVNSKTQVSSDSWSLMSQFHLWF